MIVAMSKDATAEQIRDVVARISEYDLRPVEMPGGDRVAIGIASAIPPELRETLAEVLEIMPGVDHVTHVSRPYKLASREFHQADTIVDISDVKIGSNRVVIIAGPCAVESREQMLQSAEAVKKAGAAMLRGGAFKPRTSPYAFQGLGKEGLQILREVGDYVGLPVITEVMDQYDLDLVCEYADAIQIGARNMQNYSLLTAAGRANKPVVLKRGPSATIDEWLLAAEYILCKGNENVILCERGVHPLDRSYVRYTLDVSAVPVVKSISHLPIIVDPSHASGVSRYVVPLSRAALAAGADGLLVEVHSNPVAAKCDSQQQLNPESFAELVLEVREIARAIGRSL